MQDPTIVTNPPEKFAMRVVTSGLEGPWEIIWGPDQQLWVTERRGRRVIRVNPVDGTRSTLLTLHEVHQSVTQDGLLGLALHPDFLKSLVGNNDVYRTTSGNSSIPIRFDRADADDTCRRHHGTPDAR